MKTTYTFLLLLISPAIFSQAPEVGLHMAALQGNLEAIEQHIAAGTDLNARDAYGSTPLIIATTFGKPAVAKALIGAGADLNAPNAEGSSPLHLAALFGRSAIARALIEGGADPDLLTQNGAKPYDIAAGPFARDVPVLDQISAGLSPLGFKLDYEAVKRERKAIAALLRPATEDLEDVEFAPVRRPDWPVSTPQAEGLDPMLVAEMFYDASHSENLYSLLVVKNGKLVAEGYFNKGSIDHPNRMASVTKSVTSALYGLALHKGHLESLDQKMLDFFPEIAEKISDPRKRSITLRHLLQMRGGYPWEETDTALWAGLLTGYYVPLLEKFPLVNDPGTAFNYSNLSSNWLGIILDRTSGKRLRDYALEYLFGPLGIEPGPWGTDAEGHNNGCANLHLRPRDVAKFGLLYLNEGEWAGEQLIPAGWVKASLDTYSPDAWVAVPPQPFVGRFFNDFNYGFQWWTANIGGKTYKFAWGHGGQIILLLDDLDMVIVATSNPYFLQHDSESWKFEQSTFNLVGKFVSLLPK